MRVLIADKVSGLVPKTLRSQGFEVSMEPQQVQHALATRVAEWDPEILVVRGTRVNADSLTAGKRLSLVIRAGAGVNTIDTQAAAEHGIYVSNCPGLNATAVAELVMGHLINLDRRLVDNAIALREGKWRKSALSVEAKGLAGRTLAVVGCGHIGKEVIRLAHAFGMRVQAWSRSLLPRERVLSTLHMRRA